MTPATSGLVQEPHRPVHPAVADDRPSHPLRRRQQDQRREEVGHHHVLQHVSRVEVLLGEVVQRPVRRQPEHQHRGHEAADVAPADRRLARLHRRRPDAPDEVDVGPDEEPDEDGAPPDATETPKDCPLRSTKASVPPPPPRSAEPDAPIRCTSLCADSDLRSRSVDFRRCGSAGTSTWLEDVEGEHGDRRRRRRRGRGRRRTSPRTACCRISDA